MKKFLSILLCLMLVLGLAACAADPAGGNSTTTTTTTTTAADTDPTDPPVEDDPVEEVPTDIGEAGYCAVGIVDTAAKTAKVVGGNGAVQEITYTGVDPEAGLVYGFVKEGETYTLSAITYFNSYDYESWGLRTYDKGGEAPDSLAYWDSTIENPDDGTMGYILEVSLTDEAAIFVRYSATEWRVLSGSDAIAASDYPMPGWFVREGDADVGYTCPVLLVGTKEGAADEAATYLLDPEGFGWAEGDIVIE